MISDKFSNEVVHAIEEAKSKKILFSVKEYFYGPEKNKEITTLIYEYNLQKLTLILEALPNYKKVAILGQPGAGKSTLLKKITNSECVPLPIIGQHTDATDWSQSCAVDLIHIYNDTIFVDVPGYETATHPIMSFIKYFPFKLFDCFLIVFRDKLKEADSKLWLELYNLFYCEDHHFNDSPLIQTNSIVNKIIIVRSASESLIHQQDRKIILEDIREKLLYSSFKKAFRLSDVMDIDYDNKYSSLRVNSKSHCKPDTKWNDFMKQTPIYFTSNRTNEGIDTIIRKIY
jgi:hypothetical protein